MEQAALAEIACIGVIVLKLRAQPLGEMMSLQANNNHLAHFFLWLSSLCPDFFCKSLGKQEKCSFLFQMEAEIQRASTADRGQINKAFGYFKKMTEEAHRQPRAAPQPQHCVFTVLFLRERQRAAKLKQSHRVIIFSHVCCRLVQKRPLSSPGIKSSSMRRELERTPRRAHTGKHIITESDTAIIISTSFHSLQLE